MLVSLACHVAWSRWIVSLAWRLSTEAVVGMSMGKGLANTDFRVAEQFRNTRKSHLCSFARGKPTTNYVIMTLSLELFFLLAWRRSFQLSPLFVKGVRVLGSWRVVAIRAITSGSSATSNTITRRSWLKATRAL